AGSCFAADTETCTAQDCVTPTATIAYAGPYCIDITTPQVVSLNGTGTYQGGTYTASPSGLSINATSGAIQPSASTAGTYTVTYTVAGVGNCPGTTATTQVTINALTVPTFAQPPAICEGTTLAELPTTSINGITGTWSPALNNTATTTYTFTPINSACATTTTLTITVNPILKPVVNCGNTTTNSVSFNWSAVSGATSYNVNYRVNNGSVVNVGSVGNVLTYQVTGLNNGDKVDIMVTPVGPATGCFESGYATCTAEDCTVPTATIGYAGPYCIDISSPQLVTLTGTGTFNGGTFTASPAGLNINSASGAITPSLSTAGTYTITYTVAGVGNCPGTTATTTVTITALTVPTFAQPPAICEGATLAALPTTSLNNITGTWSPALNNNATTTYTFTPINSECATTATLTITVDPRITAIATGSEIGCGETTGSIVVTAQGGTGPYEYSINNGNTWQTSNNFQNLAEGNYTILVKGPTGCTGSTTATVTQLVSDLAITADAPPIPCGQTTGSITLRTTGGRAAFQYSINGGPYGALATFNNLQPGTYNFMVKDANNCVATVRATLSPTPLPRLVIVHPATVCLPGTANITLPAVTAGSDAGLTYTYWTNAAATIPLPNPGAIATGGTYYIKATAANGCSVVLPVNVQLAASPTFRVTDPAEVCAPETVDLTDAAVTAGSDAGLTYTYWRDAAATIPLENPQAVGVSGTYYIRAASAGTCAIVRSVEVKVNVFKAEDGLRYTPILADPNTPMQLNARELQGALGYLWAPPDGINNSRIRTPIFRYDKSTEYLITIDNGNGCKTVDTLLVKMRDPDPVSDIFVPKAWSPNGDGHNDRIYPLCVNIVELKFFRVFNRWGQLMFETNIIGYGWDGMYKGQPQVSDTYTWTLDATGIDGVHYRRSGNVWLSR
ncbi:MAG TPA: T9SS type B sorting domain-containing protein, partial [Phnomibacter sp.]|nr:T9SS type B sorting domain-containing protein [Phnomibacter sp.]